MAATGPQLFFFLSKSFHFFYLNFILEMKGGGVCGGIDQDLDKSSRCSPLFNVVITWPSRQAIPVTKTMRFFDLENVSVSRSFRQQLICTAAIKGVMTDPKESLSFSAPKMWSTD